MRILVVEDEYKLADLLSSRLSKEKYIVDIALDGDDGSFKALSNIYDLILLDVMLPYKDGFTILEEIRNNDISSKVIMLTAKSELDDKLFGFGKGADDYVTKPFHLEEVVARVNNQLKGNNVKNINTIEFSDLVLFKNTSKIQCRDNGEEIEVLKKEYQLLECFMRNPNQIISKDFLFDSVWGLDSDVFSNNLEVFISFIRKKLKAIDSKVVIKAVRGLGYKMEVNNEKVEE